MNDLNDKITERWQTRRKKGNNWPRLAVMVLVLAAILYAMGILHRSANVVSNVPSASTQDSSRVEIPAAEQTP
ncbi:MAG: hypothetical protein PHT47_00240 [Candidatus Cloacimonetes bacterium]|nr:hypothetical protein [Candidatus Cloacimonadota bacterium]MDD4099501.1 hypothetical protein [Candidatus Cloacimonadota bacterium]MDD4805609.1 hypothetical protein [Candidatus Cloacimonadota bacterium]